MTKYNKTILIDMDGVLCDFESQFVKYSIMFYPYKNYMSPQIQTHPPFENDKAYKDYTNAVIQILSCPDFYKSMKPIDGAIEQFNELSNYFENIFICTRPFVEIMSNCATEKFIWVNNNLGHKWLDKIIITPHKHLIKGDILIDDNDYWTGFDNHIYHQFLYDAPYNKDINLPRLTWSNWKEIVIPWIESQN